MAREMIWKSISMAIYSHMKSIQWYGKERVIITGSGGNCLDVSVDACAFAKVIEVPRVDGVGADLGLLIELDGPLLASSSTRAPTRVYLMFPGHLAREEVEELVRLLLHARELRQGTGTLEVHAHSNQPVYRGMRDSPDNSSQTTLSRHAATVDRSVRDDLYGVVTSMAGRHLNVDNPNRIETSTHPPQRQPDPEGRADPTIRSDKNLSETAGSDLSIPSNSPRPSEQSAPSASGSLRLRLTHVPDNEDWLSFLPLSNDMEISINESLG